MVIRFFFLAITFNCLAFKSAWVLIYVIFGEVIADEQSEINDDVCDVDDGFVFHESPIFLEESYNFMSVPYFPSPRLHP